ncbi:MAG: glycosyltransferase family 2 protein [Muribaculaceae bacterium]|nr:glycosyltransferase family 2 protein [Muribaculaceae bacterium]
MQEQHDITKESVAEVKGRENPVLSIILPCYNEEEVLESSNVELLEELQKMKAAGVISEKSYILYVDDGSRDRTWSIIESLCEKYPHVAGLKLSRNEGQQAAIIAGLEVALRNCDVMVTVDVDLQDDITVISQMVRDYKAGADVVYGVRDDRQRDSWFKRETAMAFYRLMQKLGTQTVFNHSEFRLISRRGAEAFLSFSERNLFIRGLLPMIGFKQTKVLYDRRERKQGETKYSTSKLVNLAVNGITSLSVRPVRMLIALSMIFLLVALGILIYVLYNYFIGRSIEGWASMMLSIWFCSGMILLGLGIVGEYMGKIYTEVKRRPLYFKDVYLPPGQEATKDEAESENPRQD